MVREHRKYGQFIATTVSQDHKGMNFQWLIVMGLMGVILGQPANNIHSETKRDLYDYRIEHESLVHF